MFNSDSDQYIKHPGNFDKKTYLFFDTVHIMKNIRNNLLNGKKFVFPEFIYNDGLNIDINFPAGFIQWKDLYNIYDKDKELSSNLRKAPKLSYQALHPGNSKQSVPLALAIRHETTIAAAKSYFPTRSDLSGFLSVINVWWTISNSKQRYTSNILGNAVILGDKKTEFYRVFADWIELWCESPYFKLTAQTKSALVTTLRAQADLIDELIYDGYQFVRTARL
jgi:hypothetical protein